MNGKIGIVLVNFNGRKDTIACIRSIQKSTYDNYVIIVVDNHSREEERMMDFDGREKITVKILEENTGFAAANNIGAEIALEEHADFILCLNNDTVVSSELLEKLVAACEQDSVVTCRINYYSNHAKIWYGGGKVSKIFGTFRHQHLFSSQYVTYLCGCCFLMPVNIYQKAGLFSEQFFMYCEDADLSIRLIQNGFRIKYVSDAVIWHKVGKSADSIEGLKLYYTTRNRMIVLKKWKKFFSPAAWVYFWITRLFLAVILLLKGEQLKYMKQAVADYRKGRTGKSQLF